MMVPEDSDVGRCAYLERIKMGLSRNPIVPVGESKLSPFTNATLA